MIILGIDPGTAALGYGIVERIGGRLRAVDFGVFETRADEPLPERLRLVHRCVTDLIELHRPGVVGVERLFFTRNAQTAFAVGQARGVVLLAAAQHGIAVREATPNEVKSAIAGYGAADKEQVARMIRVVLGLAEPPTPDDAADALGVAIWVANTESGAGLRATGALDRSALAPPPAGSTPYERAVRDAVRAERAQRSGRPSGGHGPGGRRALDGRASDAGTRRSDAGTRPLDGRALDGRASDAGTRRSGRRPAAS